MSRLRFGVCGLCLAVLPCVGQESSSRTYVFDANGRRVEWSATRAGDSSRSETIATINGTRATLEQVEEKVLLKEPGRTVVERLIKRKSPDGQPLPPEKIRIETAEREDGSSTESVTRFQGDLNGILKPAERSVTHSLKAGNQIRSETSVERVSINGAFSTVERRASTTVAGENQSETNVVVYRPDASGRMAEAARQVLRQAVKDNLTTEQADEYENASTGKMRLSRQTVSRIVKNPDGSERKEVDVFGANAPGRAMAGEGALQLRERQIYDRRPVDGQVVEQFSIQRPALHDARSLSAPQLISETVCVGKCK
jgi:hypothetical protein